MKSLLKSFFFLTLFMISSGLFPGCSESEPDSGTNPPINRTITVSINEPATGISFSQPDVIRFNGSAKYDDTNSSLAPETLVWTSNIDGIIGVGNTYRRSGLSTGSHTITLTATGSAGEIGNAIIELANNRIGNGITVIIDSPPSGTSLKSHDLLEFTGRAFDRDNNPITNRLDFQWSSNFDQILGNGSRIVPGDFTTGLHTITLIATARDGSGLEVAGRADIELSVENDNSGDISMAILQPQSGFQLRLGEEITFVGEATENNSRIMGSDLVWTSSMHDDPIGLGETCIVNNMLPGIHRVTMKATTSSGKKSVTSIIVNVIE